MSGYTEEELKAMGAWTELDELAKIDLSDVHIVLSLSGFDKVVRMSIDASPLMLEEGVNVLKQRLRLRRQQEKDNG